MSLLFGLRESRPPGAAKDCIIPAGQRGFFAAMLSDMGRGVLD